jgi:hypothetical protein
MIGFRRHSALSTILAVAVLSLASACSKSDSSALPSIASQALPTAPSTPTTTTPATPATTVETFTGTFAQGGYGIHPFTQTARGSLTVTLSDVGPDNTLTIGAGVGVWDGTSCTLISGGLSDTAKVGWSVTGTAVAGNFCAAVYDAGTVAADTTITYTITVEHS